MHQDISDSEALRIPGLFSDRFGILERIGGGGTSSVFKAHDSKLQRIVALKVLHPQLKDDPIHQERMNRELTLVSRICHPNVLRPLDKTEFNGSSALVMDYIEGGTLSALLTKHGPLPVDRVTSFAIQIVNALNAIHEKGIVHRDLKPQNILIDIKTDHLYLIDFGYARDVKDVDGTLTLSGAPIGTSFYVSPEQLAEWPIDQRTDIYSFGLLLRDMCAGQPHPVAGIRSPVQEDLPAHLSAIILRCTQQNPADRYATAQQILADLQGSAPARGRCLQDWSRQCLMAASAVVRERIGRYRYLGLILTALLLTGIFLSNRLNTSTSQTNVHQGKQEFAITDSDAIPTSSHQLYLEALQELGTDDLESKKRGAHLLKRAVEADPINLQAHIMAATANLELYKAEQEPPYISEAESSATQARSLGQDLFESTLMLARIYNAGGQWKKTIRMINDTFPKAVAPDEACRLLGEAYLQIDDIDLGVAEFERAARQNPMYWGNVEALGGAYLEAGRLQKAERQFQKLIQMQPARAEAFRSLGTVRLYSGRFSDALNLFEKALRLKETAFSYYQSGRAYYFLRRYHTAASMFEKAIALDGTTDLYVGGLGDALRWSQSKEALPTYVKAIRLVEGRMALKREEDAELIGRVGLYYAKIGTVLKAKSLLKTATTLRPDNKTLMYYEAVVAASEHNYSQAEIRAQQAVARGYPKALVAADPDLLPIATSSAR